MNWPQAFVIASCVIAPCWAIASIVKWYMKSIISFDERILSRDAPTNGEEFPARPPEVLPRWVEKVGDRHWRYDPGPTCCGRNDESPVRPPPPKNPPDPFPPTISRMEVYETPLHRDHPKGFDVTCQGK